MVRHQGLPADAPEVNPGAAQQESESQSTGDLPPHPGLSAGSPVPEETSQAHDSASAGPGEPGQQPSPATSVTSHSSARVVEPMAFNRLCVQPLQGPAHQGLKRKRSGHGTEAEVEREEKCLFYMRVQAMNSVSVAWETGAGFGTIRKQPRIFQASYAGGESFAGSSLSSCHTKSELGDLDLEAEAEGALHQAIASQEAGMSPEGLLRTEQGLRCMACCRLFPTLQALIRHVKHGLGEGFSCRVYHQVLGRLRAGETPRRKRRRGDGVCSSCGGKIRCPRKAAR